MNCSVVNQKIPPDYKGQLLFGDYSESLRSRVLELFCTLQKIDSLNPPVISYLAAWNEIDKIIWYEFSGKRLWTILDCHPENAAERFRRAVVDRRIYCYNPLDKKVTEEIISISELEGQCEGLREKVKISGCTEAIYKLNVNDRFFWFKDQARIECFSEDHICISIGFLTDMTKEMEQKELVEKIGYFDELTSLPRRVIMDRIFEINFGLYTRGSIDDFIFMMIDIDHFKRVNDTFGHQAGDYILASLAELISSSKRKEDEIGRYGGEEFFCFSLGSIENGLGFAERLRKTVEQHGFLFQEYTISITISIGVVAASQILKHRKLEDSGNKLVSGDSQNELSGYYDIKKAAEKMVEYADKALYKVKQGGRNQVKLFESTASINNSGLHI